MASADLDHIRALLIAQTAEPEPKPGPFRLFAKRAGPRAPLALTAEAEPVRRPPPAPVLAPRMDHGQELLLERICAEPPRVQETCSPLPPLEPRSAFGRRAEPDELELMLDRPEPDQTGAVPYFPEDLSDGEAELEQLFTEPQPLRPWIKALRNSGRPPVIEPAPAIVPKPTPKPRVRRARLRTPPSSPVTRCAQAEALSRDLMEALELALTREHHRLDDRLAALELFRSGLNTEAL